MASGKRGVKRIRQIDFNPKPDILALRDYLAKLSVVSLCDYACELSRTGGGFAMATALNLQSPMREIYYALGLASTTDEPTIAEQLDRDRLAEMLNAVHDKYAVRFMTPSARTSYDAKMTAMDSFTRAFLAGRNVSVMQVKERTASYLSPFDATLKATLGISATEMTAIADWLIANIQEQLNGIRRLYEQAEAPIFSKAAQADLRASAHMKYDRWLHDVQRSELEKQFGVELSGKFTSRFCLQRAQVSDGYFWFDDKPNPFARRPVLDLGNGRLAVPIANELHNAIWDVCSEALASSKDAKRFFKHRGSQLEKDGAVSMRRVFSDAAIYGPVFEKPGTDEHDLLILRNDVAIILEAKAGEPAMPMRDANLAFNRLQQQFRSDSGIQHGYRQGQNLANRLLGDEAVTLYDEHKKPLPVIASGTIKRAFVIVLTLENFSGLATDLTTLLQKSEAEPYPWAVNIYDLELFVDVFLDLRHWDADKFIQWLEERRSRMGVFTTHDELEIAGVFIEHETLGKVPADATISGLTTFANIFEDFAHEKLGDVPAELGQATLDHLVPFPEEMKNEFGEMFRGLEQQVVGRNDRCPCGSGKKYKKCHGKA